MRRKFSLIANCLLLITYCGTAQLARPKLVVGLVIDQMRWDYLYRYNDLYGPNGFKRLLREGFSCDNTMIPYVPTYTAVGHTCIYTGSVPAYTGIIGNNWFDKITNTKVYCTDDAKASTVGSNTTEGKMSPANLWVTTITDELQLSNNFKSNIVGIALKDRGAILPAGHADTTIYPSGHPGTTAYWYDDTVGRWISSSYYMRAKKLPTWVLQYNAKDPVSAYMKTDWKTLKDPNLYGLSTEDKKGYENKIKGDTDVVFPHRLSVIPDSNKYESFKTTPFANTYTLDFAKTAINNLSLGKNSVTDFLAVSISSTDYIGHAFGPNSVEIEDTYLRLDQDIADFLQYLDTKVGKGNYLLFLTADHGVAHIPAFLGEHAIPGGNFSENDLMKELNKLIETNFGLKDMVQNLLNYQVYLNTNEITNQGKDVAAVKNMVISFLKEKPFIVTAFSTEAIQQTTLPQPQKEMLINGYNPKRSGDIQFTLLPGFFDGGKKGTTHGLWNPYDAHIPLVWFGWNVKPGKTNRETYMTDITATVAAMLKIQMPSGCVGKVITEVAKTPAP